MKTFYENENDNNNSRINNSKTITSKSFEYKTKLIESTPNNNNTICRSCCCIKYLSNFGRSLDLLLINCGIELDLRWTKNCT